MKLCEDFDTKVISTPGFNYPERTKEEKEVSVIRISGTRNLRSQRFKKNFHSSRQE